MNINVEAILESGRTIFGLMMKKLYLVLIVPAVYIAYKFIQAITKEDANGKSIYNSIMGTIDEATKDATSLSDTCFTAEKLLDFSELLRCIGF
jgi:hypothetical protein